MEQVRRKLMISLVIAGLGPAIHHLARQSITSKKRFFDGCAGQARA
jgi:hypothetical protein